MRFKDSEAKNEMDFNDTMSLEHVSPNDKDAIHLEDALFQAELAQGIPIENIEHNPFDENFPVTCFDGIRGQGFDNKITTSKGKIALECKDLIGKDPLTKAWFEVQFFRDKDIPYILKILVIGVLNCSKEVRRWLVEDMHVKIWELGFKVTTRRLKQKAIDILTKKLYWLKMKYFYQKVKAKMFPIFHTRPYQEECISQSETEAIENKEREVRYEATRIDSISKLNSFLSLYSHYSYVDKYREVVSNIDVLISRFKSV